MIANSFENYKIKFNGDDITYVFRDIFYKSDPSSNKIQFIEAMRIRRYFQTIHELFGYEPVIYYSQSTSPNFDDLWDDELEKFKSRILIEFISKIVCDCNDKTRKKKKWENFEQQLLKGISEMLINEYPTLNIEELDESLTNFGVLEKLNVKNFFKNIRVIIESKAFPSSHQKADCLDFKSNLIKKLVKKSQETESTLEILSYIEKSKLDLTNHTAQQSKDKRINQSKVEFSPAKNSDTFEAESDNHLDSISDKGTYNTGTGNSKKNIVFSPRLSEKKQSAANHHNVVQNNKNSNEARSCCNEDIKGVPKKKSVSPSTAQKKYMDQKTLKDSYTSNIQTKAMYPQYLNDSIESYETGNLENLNNSFLQEGLKNKINSTTSRLPYLIWMIERLTVQHIIDIYRNNLGVVIQNYAAKKLHKKLNGKNHLDEDKIYSIDKIFAQVESFNYPNEYILLLYFQQFEPLVMKLPTHIIQMIQERLFFKLKRWSDNHYYSP